MHLEKKIKKNKKLITLKNILHFKFTVSNKSFFYSDKVLNF